MVESEIKFKIQIFEQAVSTFNQAVAQKNINDDSFVRDSVIQRFEFSFELAWKTLKKVLENEGFLPKTPRETLVYAFKAGLINNQMIWLEMLESR